MAASFRRGISRAQSRAPRPGFRRRPPHSVPYPNASQSECAELTEKPPHKIRADFRRHPRTRSCRGISSTKKLRGGSHASVAKGKSAACRSDLPKTRPACGTARLLLLQEFEKYF